MMIIKKFIWNFDYFAATPGFRMNGEAEVVSVCGGILSILLLLAFFYIFIDDAIQMFKYQKIQAKQTIKINKNGTDKITDFMFAIGIEGFTQVQIQSYLEIEAFLGYRDYNTTVFVPFDIEFCKKSQWAEVQNIEDYFEMFEMDQMLCPTESTNLTITGLKSDPQQISISLQIYVCLGQGFCLNTTDMLNFMDQYVGDHRYFTVNFFFLNTGFNLGEKDSTFKYIDDTAWVTFTEQIGTEALVQIGTYNITTDHSFFPYKDQRSVTGHYVSSIKESVIQPSRLNDPLFADIEIYLSRKSKVVERKFGKIDEILGYVGGLFSIVFAFFAFFAMSYNQYRYELMVAEGAFSYENGERYKDEDFTVFTYIKYSIYDWIRFLCCCDPNWENCKRIEETREEAVEQIEVKYFMRRLAHLQNVNRLKISEAQDTVLLLAEPLNIDYLKRKRMILQYYDSVMKDKPHMTVLGLNVAQNILSLGAGGGNNITNIFFPSTSQQFMGTEDLDSILRKYNKYLEEDNAKVQLTEEEMQTEIELAELFFSLEKESLEKVRNKIPLLIMYRLKKIYGEIIEEKKTSKPVKISPTSIL